MQEETDYIIKTGNLGEIKNSVNGGEGSLFLEDRVEEFSQNVV